MPLIPRAIYALCEAKLRQRESLMRRAMERLESARAAAFAANAPRPDPNGGGRAQGGKHTPTERAAFALLQAEAEAEEAQRWAEVFALLDNTFAGTPEAEIAQALYLRRMRQADICAQMGIDRQKIRKYRDTYICHCALFAASKGIIKLEEDDHP